MANIEQETIARIQEYVLENNITEPTDENVARIIRDLGIASTRFPIGRAQVIVKTVILKTVQRRRLKNELIAEAINAIRAGQALGDGNIKKFLSDKLKEKLGPRAMLGFSAEHSQIIDEAYQKVATFYQTIQNNADRYAAVEKRDVQRTASKKIVNARNLLARYSGMTVQDLIAEIAPNLTTEEALKKVKETIDQALKSLEEENNRLNISEDVRREFGGLVNAVEQSIKVHNARVSASLYHPLLRNELSRITGDNHELEIEIDEGAKILGGSVDTVLDRKREKALHRKIRYNRKILDLNNRYLEKLRGFSRINPWGLWLAYLYLRFFIAKARYKLTLGWYVIWRRSPSVESEESRKDETMFSVMTFLYFALIFGGATVFFQNEQDYADFMTSLYLIGIIVVVVFVVHSLVGVRSQQTKGSHAESH